MKKLKAAIILDNLKIAEWQKLALEEASDLLDIKIILNCKNTNIPKKIIKNSLYYSLNLLTLRNKLSKKSNYKLSTEEIFNFKSNLISSRQCIPTEISNKIVESNIDVIIKFGMSFIKIDDSLKNIPILSFHHGDPSKYRGRPAGFYELLGNADKSGIIVQRITNQLDVGHVLAFAESKLTHYSYKRTSENFYKQSQFLLRKALLNLKKNNLLEMKTNGKDYHLPSNSTVLKFSTLLFKKRVDNIIYGTFFEKRWKVGTLNFNLDLRGDNIINASSISDIPIKDNYNFYADPFFSLDGSKIRLEALGNKSGLGDIIEIDVEDNDKHKVLLTGKHYSYPFSFLLNGEEQLLPEVASHSSQKFFNLSDKKKNLIFIKKLEDKRILDATLFFHDNVWYLFFGELESASSKLNLWVSDTVNGEFEEHPSSPICISPSSARMAGRILVTEEGIFRFGQNNNRAYGAAITISEITELSKESYDEKICGTVKIDDCYGPHSIDINKEKGLVLIDYYTDEFSAFAGVRRAKAKFAEK